MRRRSILTQICYMEFATENPTWEIKGSITLVPTATASSLLLSFNTTRGRKMTPLNLDGYFI